jgi:ribosomal-protein-alanine N-acetyltransferase
MAFSRGIGHKPSSKKGLQGSGTLLHIPMMCRIPAVFQLSPMSEAVLDQVLAIEHASFTRPWQRQHFLDELTSPVSSSLVALTQEGVVAGYICCRVIVDEAEILDVAVAPLWRRCGVGALLVREALKLCTQRGVSTVALEVRVSNRAAIHLYQQLGFYETGCRRHYYENGEDALLMQMDISIHEGQ